MSSSLWLVFLIFLLPIVVFLRFARCAVKILGPDLTKETRLTKQKKIATAS